MKKIILASAILLLASCKDKPLKLAQQKTFFLESKDSVLGCFEFEDRSTPSIIFEKNGESFDGDPQRGLDERSTVKQSGDSLYICCLVRINKNRYGIAQNSGEEYKFLTTIKEDGNLDEQTLIRNANRENFFKLDLPIEKITVKGK